MSEPALIRFLFKDDFDYWINFISSNYHFIDDVDKIEFLQVSGEKLRQLIPSIRSAIREGKLTLEVTDKVLFELSLLQKVMKETDAQEQMNLIYKWAQEAELNQELVIEAIAMPASKVWEFKNTLKLYCPATQEEKDKFTKLFLEAMNAKEATVSRMEHLRSVQKDLKERLGTQDTRCSELAHDMEAVMRDGVLHDVECMFLVDKEAAQTIEIRLDTNEIIRVRPATNGEWSSLEFDAPPVEDNVKPEDFEAEQKKAETEEVENTEAELEN